MISKTLRWLLAVALLSAGLAMAQQEPSMNDIYNVARQGNLSQAQSMVQQVLVAHPNSYKAHFVEAELYARQGDLGRAREALSAAQRIAPGLPAIKPEAVQALRNQLNGPVPAPMAQNIVRAPAPVVANPASGNWLLPVLLAGGVIVIAFFAFRPRNPQNYADNGAIYNGQQPMGPNGGSVVQPTYGPSPYGPQPGYGQQPMYGQAPGSGLGGRIMGGVATGLAVGAGVVAAEAIGRNLMGEHESSGVVDRNYTNYQTVDTNPDMGGQNFGISDTSWDDGGGSNFAGGGGGGDWDS